LVVVVSKRNRPPLGKRKKALWASAFFVSALLCAPLAWAQCPRLPGGYHGEVEYVYDGDTVRLSDGQRVRLIGIDTPEMGRKGVPDQPGALEAKRWLQQNTQGQKVYILPGVEPKDRYGRTLAHLYLDNNLLAEQMLRRGLGFALAVGANTRLADCLFAAEAEPRRAAVGVWRHAPRAAMEIDRPGFAIVNGRISGITRTRTGYYVDLDDHLALFVPERLATVVTGLHPGARVEARGWVQDRLQRDKPLRPGQQRWLLRITARQHLQVD
jgi:endonuclease YncB( thermonuclease family)